MWRIPASSKLSVPSIIQTLNVILLNYPDLSNLLHCHTGRRSFVFLFRLLGQSNRTWAINVRQSVILIHLRMHSSQTRLGFTYTNFLRQCHSSRSWGDARGHGQIDGTVPGRNVALRPRHTGIHVRTCRLAAHGSRDGDANGGVCVSS